MAFKRKSIDGTRQIWTCFILSPLILLLAIWIFAALYFLVLVEIDDLGNHGHDTITNNHVKNVQNQPNNSQSHQQMIEHLSSKLLSRNPEVTVSSSARGNLGPPSVLNQNPPGKDWLKDRWQAASDMGGTAIPGSHWVIMDFTGLVYPTTAISTRKWTISWSETKATIAYHTYN